MTKTKIKHGFIKNSECELGKMEELMKQLGKMDDNHHKFVNVSKSNPKPKSVSRPKLVSKSKSRPSSKSKPTISIVKKFQNTSSSTAPSRSSSRSSNAGLMVPELYQINNGFSGMLRDVVLRLCNIIWYNSNGIRAIFGMLQEHYLWRVHLFFLKGRPISMGTKFHVYAEDMGDESMYYHIKHTPLGGLNCTFISDEHDTIYMDARFMSSWRSQRKEVYRWDMQIKYAERTESTFWAGAVWSCNRRYRGDTVKDRSRLCLHDSLATDGSDGYTWAFRFERSADMKTLSWDVVGIDEDPEDCGKAEKARLKRQRQALKVAKTRVPNNAEVALELAVDNDTLSFFVGGTKVPDVIHGPYFPVFLGMAGSVGSSFTSLSFRRLPAATFSRVALRVWPGCQAEEY